METQELNFLDLHYHVSPDLYVRKHSILSAGKELKEAKGIAVLKSHLGCTVDQVSLAQELEIPVLASQTLNAMNGGIHYKFILNSIAKYPKYKEYPLLVYFPTLTSHSHSSKLNQKLTHPCLRELKLLPENVMENGKLRAEVHDVLKLGKDYPICFATGHSSHKEVLALGEAAYSLGLSKILITHPTHPCVGLSMEDLFKLSEESIFWFEQTALNFELNYQTEEDFKKVLTKLPRLVFSSDFGQIEQPGILEWYLKYKKIFESFEISKPRIQDLFLNNPIDFLSFRRVL
jgi:hypothetical protein